MEVGILVHVCVCVNGGGYTSACVCVCVDGGGYTSACVCV